MPLKEELKFGCLRYLHRKITFILKNSRFKTSVLVILFTFHVRALGSDFIEIFRDKQPSKVQIKSQEKTKRGITKKKRKFFYKGIKYII